MRTQIKYRYKLRAAAKLRKRILYSSVKGELGEKEEICLLIIDGREVRGEEYASLIIEHKSSNEKKETMTNQQRHDQCKAQDAMIRKGVFLWLKRKQNE